MKAQIVDIERVYSLVDELKQVDKNKAIKSGLKRGAAVFVRVGKSELRRRNNQHTGNLIRSFTTRLAKRKLSAYSGFNRRTKLKSDKGLGNHAHLVDRGTTDRYTKKGYYRGKMPASYFWTEAKNRGAPEAMKKVEEGVIQMVEKLKKKVLHMISEEKLTIGIYTRAKLLADAEIASLLGTKVYPSVAPEGTLSPFIVYERDSYDTSSTKMGVYREESEIVFEVVTDDYDTGLEIALAMRRVLQGKHGGFTFEIMFSREYYMEKKFRQLLQFKIS